MHQLSPEKRAQLFHHLAEGNSVRSTSRLCDVAFNSVLNFLPLIGEACRDYQDKAMRGLPCKRLQLDEIWAFCYAKERNVPNKYKGKLGYGDLWTWIALDQDTKLVPCFHVGKRGMPDATAFIDSLASRLANRVQLTTDGHTAYLSAVENAFGCEIDFSQIVKLYGSAPDGPELRYTPPQCIGITKTKVSGSPDMSKASTSHVEAQNLTLRMSNRRFGRLTNAHSKKLANHKHSLAVHFMHHNFCKIHTTLRITPAMAAGISDHVWELAEVIALISKKSVEKAA